MDEEPTKRKFDEERYVEFMEERIHLGDYPASQETARSLAVREIFTALISRPDIISAKELSLVNIRQQALSDCGGRPISQEMESAIDKICSIGFLAMELAEEAISGGDLG